MMTKYIKTKLKTKSQFKSTITGILMMILCFYFISIHAHQLPTQKYPKVRNMRLSCFVSFSMPAPLLLETLEEGTRLHIPMYLNGLYENSMEKTALKIMALSRQIKHLNLNIDPTLFERYHITKVPALVVEGHHTFDVIYGNLTLRAGLKQIESEGESGFQLDSYLSFFKEGEKDEI